MIKHRLPGRRPLTRHSYRRCVHEAERPRLRVRTAVLADADKLAALNAVVQALHHREHPELFKAPDLDASTSQFLMLLAQPEVTILLAEVDGRPTGYSYVELFDRPETAFTHAHSHLYVHHLVVANEAQRSGVGRALLDAVKAMAWRLDVRDVRLDYWCFNAPAAGFFTSQGFVPYIIKARTRLQDAR